MQKPMIYLDYNATTPISSDVVAQLPSLIQEWGNPSSIHLASRGPKQILRETRAQLAQYLECSPLEIIFNSGASEGNNTVLKSVWLTQQELFKKGLPYRNEFLVSSVEHPSVMKTAHYLQSQGAVVHFIPVNRQGALDFEFIKNKLSSETALVSLMLANNETGTLFPVTQVCELAHQFGALVHSDVVQAFGKIDISLKSLNVDYATFSAHKFYALKGCGFLFVRKNAPYVNLIHGGGQERARRGGTENILGIASLQVMSQKLNLVKDKQILLKKFRDQFEKDILSSIPDVYINSTENERLPNTSSLIIKGVDGETLLVSLDLKGFAVSTGAACSSGNPEPSPVLLAIGLTREEAQNSLRVSFGWNTTQEDVEQFVEVLKETVIRLRNLNS